MATFRATFALLASAALTVAAPASARSLRPGGKLLLTNGIASLEGVSGGGLTPWAVIAGNETADGIGLSAHATIVELKDYSYRSGGVGVGLFDRVELTYATQHLDTNQVGARLGLARNYAFDQDIVAAKLRVTGDLVYGPAMAVGVIYKKNRQGAMVRAIGARHDEGVDFYLTASKLLLARSILASGTLRLTKANQLGLLGFGGDKGNRYSLQAEGSLAWQASRRLVVGAEYRTKPDQLGFARERDWFDLFAAVAVSRRLTATAAYTDLGPIATAGGQRGALLSLQAAY